MDKAGWTALEDNLSVRPTDFALKVPLCLSSGSVLLAWGMVRPHTSQYILEFPSRTYLLPPSCTNDGIPYSALREPENMTFQK